MLHDGSGHRRTAAERVPERRGLISGDNRDEGVGRGIVGWAWTRIGKHHDLLPQPRQPGSEIVAVSADTGLPRRTRIARGKGLGIKEVSDRPTSRTAHRDREVA